MSREDFDIPELGPAEPERVGAVAGNGGANAPSANAERRSGGWFQSLLLILLVAACSGLGYWGLTLFERLQQESQNVVAMKEELAALRASLNIAETSAQASGSSLQERLAAIENSASAKNKHFDSEIAKLWAIAHKQNKPELARQSKVIADQEKIVSAQREKLAAQEKQLASLQAALGGYESELATLRKRVDADRQAAEEQGKQLAALEQDIGQAQSSMADQFAALQPQLGADLKKIRAEIAAAQTNIRLSEEALVEDQNVLKQAQRGLTDRIAVLERGARSGNSGLQRRVKANEDAVKSFDAIRRELNRNLIQIKKKINALQLAVEQQSKR